MRSERQFENIVGVLEMLTVLSNASEKDFVRARKIEKRMVASRKMVVDIARKNSTENLKCFRLSVVQRF